MTDKQLLLEEKQSLLKKMLDENLEIESFLECTIKKQREELKEVEALLEKIHTTPIYFSRG